MASGDTRILTPWPGKAARADKIIFAAFAASGILPLALLPLIPAMVSSHPALLELIRGSAASIINMGARARIGRSRSSPLPCSACRR